MIGLIFCEYKKTLIFENKHENYNVNSVGGNQRWKISRMENKKDGLKLNKLFFLHTRFIHSNNLIKPFQNSQFKIFHLEIQNHKKISGANNWSSQIFQKT